MDVCTGLKKDMLLFKQAVIQAKANPGAWEAHPTRKNQHIQRVEGVASLWLELEVPLHVCVVRFKSAKNKSAKNKSAKNKSAKKNKAETKDNDWQYLVFATTDMSLSARQIIQTYQVRTEIEEDYRQLKSPAWQIGSFLTTRLVQILWHVCLTLIAYNLFQVYANTELGKAFARKTKQRLEREQKRQKTFHYLVCTAEAFGLFETNSLLYLMLDLPEDVRQRIRQLLQPQNE